MLYLITLFLTKTFSFQQILQIFITLFILIISINSFKSYQIKSKNLIQINSLQLQKSLKFKTILIFTSSLSSLPLHLIQSLSKTNHLQLIIILPTTSSSTNSKDIELINLLRELNPQLFLERCDLSNPSSLIQFVQSLIKSLQLPSNSNPLHPPLTFQLHSILFFNHSPQDSHLQSISSPLLILQLLLPFLTSSSHTTLPIKIIPIYPSPANHTHTQSIRLFQSFQSSLKASVNQAIPLHILPTQTSTNQSDLLKHFNHLSRTPSSLFRSLKFVLKYPLLPTSRDVINDLLYMIVTPSQVLPVGKVYENQRAIHSSLNSNSNQDKELLLIELDQNSNLIKSLMKSN